MGFRPPIFAAELAEHHDTARFILAAEEICKKWIRDADLPWRGSSGIPKDYL